MTSTEGPSPHAGAAHEGGSARSTGARPGIGELIHRVSDQVQGIVRDEIALVKAKAARVAKVAGAGAGLLAAGVVTGLFLVGWILHTIEISLAHALPDWAAALIVTGLLLIVTVVLVLVGIARLQRGLKSLPRPAESLRADVEAVKKGVRK